MRLHKQLHLVIWKERKGKRNQFRHAQSGNKNLQKPINQFFCWLNICLIKDWNCPYQKQKSVSNTWASDESIRGRQNGAVPVQRPAHGAIPTNAVSFDEVQDKLPGTTARHLSIQRNSPCATGNVARTFPQLHCIFPRQPRAFRM